jgi:hypothetical protein
VVGTENPQESALDDLWRQLLVACEERQQAKRAIPQGNSTKRVHLKVVVTNIQVCELR